MPPGPTSAGRPCLHFHSASECATRILADMLDSLVRVTRRVAEPPSVQDRFCADDDRDSRGRQAPSSIAARHPSTDADPSRHAERRAESSSIPTEVADAQPSEAGASPLLHASLPHAGMHLDGRRGRSRPTRATPPQTTMRMSETADPRGATGTAAAQRGSALPHLLFHVL